jgi:ATP-dependent DNA helicase RecG
MPKMSLDELQKKFQELISMPAEKEWVEFKEAKNSFDFDELGKYFSALSNEANLKKQEHAWLVFGVTNEPPRRIVGTIFKKDRPSLDKLKRGVAEKTSNCLTFEEIHEHIVDGKRVLIFQIPPALRGIPTAWRGHHYGRDGESLGALNSQEYDYIRGQSIRQDWSAQICTSAGLEDLDLNAIGFARKQYKEKQPKQADEVDRWDDSTFLNKAKVCINGQITNTAVLLLGKDVSGQLLTPALAGITWVLKDAQGIELDYEHWGTPLILAVDQVLGRIRNLTVRYLPRGTLFPMEVSQYDPWVLREILHNSIAHQDYVQAGRINVIEETESVLFTNVGDFIPGSVEEVIWRDAPPEIYRNPFLAQAMVNLNMIDTIGSGIKRMFNLQRKRFFPMPDYDLTETCRVKVKLYGKILDENYTRMLIDKADIDLIDAIALDKVQKKRPITEAEFVRLKSQKLIEGRRPNLFVSAKIATATGDKATYIKHRAFDKEHYKKLVLSYLEKFKQAQRKDLDKLLVDKLSDALTESQKSNFIRNLLQEMKRDGVIKSTGTTRWSKWVLSKTNREDGD